jgi:hypothetical protein
VLLLDLLHLESDGRRASDLAIDIGALADDLLLAGAYADARPLAAALRDAAGRQGAPGREGARRALDRLAESDGLRESVAILGEVDEAAFDALRQICTAIGPAVVALFRGGLNEVVTASTRRRAADIIVGFGASAVTWLTPLVDEGAQAQWRLAELLGRLAVAEAVPLLQTLLRKGDPRAMGAAIGALATIPDPSAARAIQTVLRTATGDARRAIVAALVAERDLRVVPMLVRILDESDPVRDHTVVLDAIGALGILASDAAVAALVRMMRRRRWLARARMRVVKEASLGALMKIGSDAAVAAVEDAATRGDRQLRKAARAVGSRQEAGGGRR